MFSGATAMISTYTGVTGFGTSPNYTPTSAFFNFTPPTLDFTFDNGATAIGAISLPYQGSGIAVSVDWGDGTTDTSLTHTYTATSATAKVQLTGGTITGFGAQNWSGVALLTSVANNAGDNWGWGTGDITLDYAFYNASKLTSVPSTIPVGTSNMGYMFGSASVFNGDISGWDTSNVTNMGSVFYYAILFNGDISSWNTGNVTTMTYMFSDASVFNGDI